MARNTIARRLRTNTIAEFIFQSEFNKDKLSAFVAGSLSNTTYWRYDRLFYDKAHAKSDKVSFLGFTAKGGANYNITENHNVFFNLGYISRAPKFSYGDFQKAQYILAGFGIQIAGGFVRKLYPYPLMP